MSVDTEALKVLELNLFKAFLEICKKYKFRYFLLGGSCLGAVRHQGFIPWDDDIDVGMPRSDYEKFLSVAQKDLPKHVFLQTSITDSEYPMNYAKLRDNTTTFWESSVKNFNMNHGVYLDIFPLDGYCHSKIFRFYNKLYMARIIQEYTLSIPMKKGIKSRIVRLVCGDYKKARDKREKLLRKYDYDISETVANYCGAWGEKEIMPKEYFGEGAKAQFEGMEVIIPEKYDLYLTKMYGNYMQFPPIEKQVSHHYCEIIDLKKSYKDYFNEVKNETNNYLWNI